MSPCTRSLISLAGVTLGRRRAAAKRREVKVKEKKHKHMMASAAAHTCDPSSVQVQAAFRCMFTCHQPSPIPQATTTPLVRNVFEQFFEKQIDRNDGVKAPRQARCGVCEACQQPDCGTCAPCKDMVKFGGTGRWKQCCINRR